MEVTPSTGVNSFFDSVLGTGGKVLGLFSDFETARAQRKVAELQAQAAFEQERFDNSINRTETQSDPVMGRLSFWQKAFFGSLGVFVLLAVISLFKR